MDTNTYTSDPSHDAGPTSPPNGSDPTGHLATPVVIDLSLSLGDANQTGDGLSFVDMYHSPVFYNMDGDYFRERTAWVGPNEGIVVYAVDKNNDGVFSRFEIALTEVVGGSSTDMEALYKGFDKGVDKNNDGNILLWEGKGDHVIDAAEAAAYNLKIWQDADMDGKVDAGEMKSFADAGIKNIQLADTNVDNLQKEGDGAKANQIVERRFSDGSVIFGTAKVELSNGKTTTAYDMGFAHESAGMYEVKSGGFVTAVKLQAQVGGGDWSFADHSNASAGVKLDFDTGAPQNGFTSRQNYYGAIGSDFGDTMIYSGAFSRSFSGGAGWDALTGGEGDDFLIGGAGADRLNGRGGNDVLYIDAQDLVNGIVDGGAGYDVLKVNSADSVAVDMTDANAEAFVGGSGADTVYAGSRMQGVMISGEAGDDRIFGGADNDILIGGNDDDRLSGGGGNDHLIGGDGIDRMHGEDGGDYIVADELDDLAYVDGGEGFDTLVIDDTVNVGAYSITRSLQDMGFEAAVGGNGGEELTLNGVAQNTFLFGMGGNDTLTTGGGDDLLAGGKGGDILNGKNGNDTYLFSRGDGQDQIAEESPAGAPGGVDTIAFGGDLTVEDVQFALIGTGGTDLKISLRAKYSTELSGEAIRIVNWKDVASRVEILSFGDGTVIDISSARFSDDSATNGLDVIDLSETANTIQALDGNDVVLGRGGDDAIRGNAGHDYLNGGEGDDELWGDDDDDTLLGGRGFGLDTLHGGVGSDYLDGGNGSDRLDGSAGEDQLYGGAGYDVLEGNAQDDILYGDTGNDWLAGGTGDDVYFVGRNEGVDTINDEGSDDDFHIERHYEDVYQGDRFVQQLVEKKVWNTSGADDRNGDVIAFGFDIALTDLAFDLNDSNDLVIGIGRGGLINYGAGSLANRVVIKNWTTEDQRIERLSFFNGAVLNIEKIDTGWSGTDGVNNNVVNGSLNALLVGGGGGDTIDGGGGSDVIVGGDGWDKLDGGSGDDVLFGGDQSDVLRGGDGKDRLFGGSGDDTIWGNGDGAASQTEDDYIVGGAGNDDLNGGNGNDTYVFGFGDGSDAISEERQNWDYSSVLTGGTDTRENAILLGSGIWFSDIKVTNTASKLIMQLVPLNRPTETATTITMNPNSIRWLQFANGYTAHFGDIAFGEWGTAANEVMDYSDKYDKGVWLNGNEGRDVLIGGGGRDVLIGGEGNDDLRGNNGSDYYVFNAFDGRDTITESGDGADGIRGGKDDSIAFGPGITLYDLSIKSLNGDLVIALRDDDLQNLLPENAQNAIVVKDWTVSGTDHRVEWLDFTYGSSFKIGDIDKAVLLGAGDDMYSNEDTSAGAEWADGGTGSDLISLYGGNDIAFGRDGNDRLDGGAGNDQLYGEGESDQIYGSGGNDELYGGDGFDNLNGGNGSDYVYGGNGADNLWGGYGSNLLNGGAGNDDIHRGGFIATADANSVRKNAAGAGVTVIEFVRGDGQDKLYLDTPNADNMSGANDQIDIFGVTKEEVWFSKTGDDLLLRILGTTDQMLFVDFYKAGSNYKFDQINVGDEKLDYEDIADLMTIMNGYTPSNGTSGLGLTASELPDNLLTAIDQHWVAA